MPDAGWYQDPQHEDRLRWWDGTAWTEHTQQGPEPAADATREANSSASGTAPPAATGSDASTAGRTRPDPVDPTTRSASAIDASGTEASGRKVLLIGGMITAVLSVGVAGVWWAMQRSDLVEGSAAPEAVRTTTSDAPATLPEDADARNPTPSPAESPTDDLPRAEFEALSYEGSVSPSSRSAWELFALMEENVGQLVYLDVRLDGEEVDAQPDWDEAGDVGLFFMPGSRNGSDDCLDEPNSCGAEYLVRDVGPSTDSGFYWSRGGWQLYGWFAISRIEGPFQGVFSVNLRAVPITEAPQAEGGSPPNRDVATLSTEVFQTPSGNIHCGAFVKGSVYCEILSGLSPPPETECDEGDWLSLSVGRTGTANPGCATDTIRRDDAPVLEYGRKWELDGVSCMSEETGLTCTNEDGRGFFLSRAAWDTY